MKKSLIGEKGNFYKACMHVHTTLSDGKHSPEEIKELYKAKGYSIVAYTDHEYFYNHSDLTDGEFLAINGYEMGTEDDEGEPRPFVLQKSAHFNFYAKRADMDAQVCYDPRRAGYYAGKREGVKHIGDIHLRTHTSEDMNYCIREGNENGFFVCYNHPVWSLHNYDDFRDLEDLWGMEIFNTASYLAGHYETAHYYDLMLMRGHRLHAVASDDAHSLGQIGRAFLMVRSEKLDYDSVVCSLLKGDYYSSTGVIIDELYEEDNKVHVKCSPAKKIVLRTGSRSTVLAEDKTGEGITEAVLEIPNHFRHYYRVEIIGMDDEENAWSNAVYMEY